MADEQLIWEARVRDSATRTLKDIDSEAGKVDSSFDSMGRTSNKSSGLMSKGLGKVAGVAGLVVAGLGAVVAGTKAAVEAAGRYNAAANTLDQVVQNATGSTEEASEVTLEYGQAIEDIGDISGKSIPEIQEALTKLTNITGDTSDAGLNLRRTLGLMAVSGKEMADAAKDLGTALTGDLGPLKEMGILTADQITDLNKMDDSSQRVAAALEILDSKLEGLPDSADKSQVALARLSNSWDQILAAFGNVLPIDGALTGIADLLDDVADGASEFAEVWNTVAPGVGAEVDRLRGKYEDLNRESGQTSTAAREDLGQKQIDALELQLETEKLLIQQRVDSGQIDEFTAQFEVMRAQAETAERIKDLEYEYGLLKNTALSAEARNLAQLERKASLQAVQNDLTRAKLKLDFDITDIQEEYSAKLEEATEDRQRALLISERDAKLLTARLAGEQAIADVVEKRAREARKIREEQEKTLAAVLAIAQGGVGKAVAGGGVDAQNKGLEARRDELAGLRLEKLQETDELQKIELERQIQLLDLKNLIVDKELTHTEAVLRRAQIEKDAAQSIADLQERNSRKEAESEKDRLSAIRLLKEEHTANTMQGIRDAESLGNALVGAFESAVGPAAILDVLRGGFMAAEAIGLAAIDPVGAVQAGIGAAAHFVNAAKFGKGGGAAGSQGATAASTTAPTVNLDESKRVAKEAYVEAFREVNQGGDARTVVIDMSGNFIGSDPASARELADLLAGTARLQLGG